jgi:hypothetical protein
MMDKCEKASQKERRVNEDAVEDSSSSAMIKHLAACCMQCSVSASSAELSFVSSELKSMLSSKKTKAFDAGVRSCADAARKR